MFVQVRCSNAGHGGRSRAGRRFENGTTYRMEVVPDDHLKKEQLDAHGNGPLDGAVASMVAISASGLAKVKADPVMSVLEGGDTSAAASDAAVVEMRQQLAVNATELSKARVRIAELEAENATLTKLASGEEPDEGDEHGKADHSQRVPARKR